MDLIWIVDFLAIERKIRMDFKEYFEIFECRWCQFSCRIDRFYSLCTKSQNQPINLPMLLAFFDEFVLFNTFSSLLTNKVCLLWILMKKIRLYSFLSASAVVFFNFHSFIWYGSFYLNCRTTFFDETNQTNNVKVCACVDT